MSESEQSSAVSKPKKKNGGFWANVKAEFKKIVWPDKKELVKQTWVVLLTSIIIGIIVALIDMGLQELIAWIMQQ